MVEPTPLIFRQRERVSRRFSRGCVYAPVLLACMVVLGLCVAPVSASHEPGCIIQYFEDGFHYHKAGGETYFNHCHGGTHSDSVVERFYTYEGVDLVEGHGGADDIHLGSDGDQGEGGKGPDQIFGGLGWDDLIGGDGHDNFYDQAQPSYHDHDIVCGGDGNDDNTYLFDGDGSDGFHGQGGAGDLPIATKDADDFVEEGYNGLGACD